MGEESFGIRDGRNDGKMWHTVWHTKRCRTCSSSSGCSACSESFTEQILVLVDLKRVSPRRALDTVGVWGSNPHAPTKRINSLRLTSTFSVTPHYAICTSTLPPFVLCAAIQSHSLGSSRRNSSNEIGICNRNDGSSMISPIYKGQVTGEDKGQGET